MRIWRVSRSHSLRRTAQHLLRENRTVDRWSVWRGRLATSLRKLEWRRPIAVAFFCHVPFVVGLVGDQIPEWLGTAWQVSGTLVGLGVALVVFLLQAAGSQSLSSDTTYRALLAHTGLIWPATFALVFLVSIGVLERYSSDGGAPSEWADTWALGAFVIQVIGFGVTFARTLTVVSPAGAARVLRETFEDAMHSAVEASLLRRIMVIHLHELAEPEVSLSTGFWAHGQPVLAKKTGVLTDVNRRLPRALARMDLEDRFTLTLEPGDPVSADDPLATFEGARDDRLERVIRRGVVIRAIELRASPVPVFNDVLDVARRALTSGSQSNFRDAMQLAADCLANLPDAYQHWGYAYSLDNVGEPFARGTEDEILRSLFAFSEEVFRAGDPEAVALMPHVATALVKAGLEKRADLLVRQATALWRHQLETAHTIGNPELEQRVHALIGKLGAQEVLAQQHCLEDVDWPLERRLDAQDRLRLLFLHQALVMKQYVDRAEHERFVDAWHHWVDWAKHWRPEHEVDELEFQAQLNTGQGLSQTPGALEAAQALLDAKQALESHRANLVFAVGTWALNLRQQGRLAGDKWLLLVPYLIGGSSDAVAASRLLRSIHTDLELQLVESWQLENWDGKGRWHPADVRLLARLWGTLLLLRAVSPVGDPPDIELGHDADWLGPEIVTEINRIESEPNDWEAAVDGRLSERVKVARAGVELAMLRESG